MGFFIGGRINISFNDISVGGIRPNFIPDINGYDAQAIVDTVREMMREKVTVKPVHQ